MKKAILIISIILIILVVIAGAGVGGYFIYKAQKSTGTKWGDKYLEKINTLMDEEKYYNTGENGELVEHKRDNLKNVNNCEIQFIKVENKEIPAMAVGYEIDNQKHVDIYEYNEERNSMNISSNPSYTAENKYADTENDYEFKYVYDIEKKEYKGLVKSTSKNGQSIMYSTINHGSVYSFSKNDITGENDKEEGIPVLPKMEQTIIEVETDNVIKLENIHELDEKIIKDAIKEEVKNIENEVITEEIKTATEEKVKELETKKEEIKVAKEEKAKKEAEEKARAEEEARKKAEEEAKKGLKVGNYRLKYGTYKSDVGQMDPSYYGTIELRQDGTFHVKANCEGSYPYKKLDTEGTYTVAQDYNSFTKQDSIRFKTNNGVSFGMFVISNNAMSDQWHGYAYTGK